MIDHTYKLKHIASPIDADGDKEALGGYRKLMLIPERHILQDIVWRGALSNDVIFEPRGAFMMFQPPRKIWAM